MWGATRPQLLYGIWLKWCDCGSSVFLGCLLLVLWLRGAVFHELSLCSSFISVAVIKYPDNPPPKKGNLSESLFDFKSQLTVQSITAEK